ncbi:hypothetical protein J5N97_012690 [Dioscorea zingiberensis]|uniref:GST N-terminal domain-containing protein n=1 Tax=Dioscorea zingiberensis TaxID=325984 RepID=A0A9D5CPS3_9LILI|nr:hypothetical protein J5N97_012690 [Dioscorea zingiberensis]
MASCASFPSYFPLSFHLQSTEFPNSSRSFQSGTLVFSTRGNQAPSRIRSRTYFARMESDASQSSQTVQEDVRNVASPSSSFLSVLCPLLKFFGGGDPSQERNEVFEVATSSISSFARLPWGSKSLGISSYPSSYLQLYEFEACPFCRRVREAMTELDLSAEVFPCPKGSLRHRTMVREIGGKEQFPFMIDLNTGVSMYESGDIVKYLFQQYGQGRQPSFGLLESTLFTGWVPTLLRAGRGMTIWDQAGKNPPEQKLELFSYENNPYARIVREALCELELPYILHNVGQGSSKSELLVKLSGSEEIPYLVDPNTGVQMGDYKKILSYLFREYSDK